VGQTQRVQDDVFFQGHEEHVTGVDVLEEDLEGFDGGVGQHNFRLVRLLQAAVQERPEVLAPRGQNNLKTRWK
jgi:hypothetical protein